MTLVIQRALRLRVDKRYIEEKARSIQDTQKTLREDMRGLGEGDEKIG